MREATQTNEHCDMTPAAMADAEPLLSIDQWNTTWRRPPRMGLPSHCSSSARDRMRLLARDVEPGSTFLEIGCAPGNFLAYVGRCLGAKLSGLDFSPVGLNWTKQVLSNCNLAADLRCEDLLETSFPEAAFDVVHSAGFIEHFRDPKEVVRKHVMLARRTGVVIITIPNLIGAYEPLIRFFAPEAFLSHNTHIMNRKALGELVPRDLVEETDIHAYGAISPDLLPFHRRWPRPMALTLRGVLLAAGLIQPVQIPGLCPTFVLRMIRK